MRRMAEKKVIKDRWRGGKEAEFSDWLVSKSNVWL